MQAEHREKLETQIGARKKTDNVFYLASVDLNPWQQDQLLSVCVSLAAERYTYTNDKNETKTATLFAIGVNKEDSEAVEEVLERELIPVVREDGELS